MFILNKKIILSLFLIYLMKSLRTSSVVLQIKNVTLSDTKTTKQYSCAYNNGNKKSNVSCSY